MNKKVRMTALAKRDFAKILEYLEEEWSNAVAHNFIKIVEENFSGIASDPKRYPYYSQDLNVRKCILTKHNTLYFREDVTEIQVLRMYDVRQNPSKLQF